MQSNDEIIAVVQAHKEGKPIQVKRGPRDGFTYKEWVFVVNPDWNFKEYEYRVFPEPRKPREWTIEVSSGRSWPFPQWDLVICDDFVRVRELLE